jgi:hypothetical protein
LVAPKTEQALHIVNTGAVQTICVQVRVLPVT